MARSGVGVLNDVVSQVLRSNYATGGFSHRKLERFPVIFVVFTSRLLKSGELV